MASLREFLSFFSFVSNWDFALLAEYAYHKIPAAKAMLTAIEPQISPYFVNAFIPSMTSSSSPNIAHSTDGHILQHVSVDCSPYAPSRRLGGTQTQFARTFGTFRITSVT